MASTVTAADLTVTITESYTLNGVNYGNSINKIFTSKGQVDQRIMSVATSSTTLSSICTLTKSGGKAKKQDTLSIATINRLFMLTQPAHLQINTGHPLDADQRDIARAQIIRDKLSQN